MSRPSSRNPKIIEAICLRLSHGETLQKICADDDMPHYSTVWRWEQEDAEFCKLSARAREIGTHYIADECLNIADNPSIEPADKRIRIDTRIRLIGKWNNKKYGDKLDIETKDTTTREQMELTDLETARRLGFVLRRVAERQKKQPVVIENE